MSQALNLLNSLSSEEVARYTITPANEPHMVINADRTITVPDYLKRIAVQHDHNIETVTFDCPRYWDDNDMSKMIVYINYMLPNNVLGAYIARNIAVDSSDSSMMHFTWTITNEITQHKGNIAFLVCIKKTEMQIVDGEEQAVEVNHWNSELNRDLYISEGLECEVGVAQLYPDIVTQLLERMTAVEQINIQASEMEALLAETQAVAATAEEVKEEALDASNYIKNSYAPAIKGNVSGEIVRVDDVSPIEHDVKCWVHGKNLFNINDYVTETDYSNNKTIYAINANRLTIGKTYTIFSSVPMQWFKISNSATGYSCVGRESSADGIMSYTFVHTRNANILETSPLRIYVNNLDRTAMYDLSIMKAMNICLVEGPAVTEYEPYLDPTTVKLTCCRRNIFNIGTVSDYQHIGDVSINGQSIHCGITSSNSSHVVNTTNKYPSGTYNLKFDYSDNAPRILLRLYNKDGSVITNNTILGQKGYTYNDAYKAFFKNGKEHIITINNDVAYWCLGFVFPVTETAPVGSVKNVYNIGLEYGDGTNQYELHDGSVNIPSSDGTCVVTSKSPTMTLFTDTPGVTIECEYNRDTTKMFESYVLTDAAKNEIAGIINNHVLTNVERVEIANMVEEDFADILQSLNTYAETLIAGGDG